MDALWCTTRTAVSSQPPQSLWSLPAGASSLHIINIYINLNFCTTVNSIAIPVTSAQKCQMGKMWSWGGGSNNTFLHVSLAGRDQASDKSRWQKTRYPLHSFTSNVIQNNSDIRTNWLFQVQNITSPSTTRWYCTMDDTYQLHQAIVYSIHYINLYTSDCHVLNSPY